MAKFQDELVLKDGVSGKLQEINNNFKKTDKVSNQVKQNIGGTEKGFGKFSKAVGVATTALKALASAMIIKQAVELTKQVADVGDKIDKTSQKIGMSRKAYQEWDYIMSQNGGSVDSLQQGFKTLTTQMEGVQKGSKDSVKAFASLGVSVKDNNGKFRNQEDVFNDSIRALQKIKDPAKQAMLANRLFGRSATELRPLLNQEAEAVDELRNKANKLGLIISDEDIDNSVKFKDSMDTLSRVFSTKFQSGVMKSFPKLTELLEAITPVVSDVGQSWGETWQKMKAENSEFFGALETAWDWFINEGIPNIGTSLKWLGEAFAKIFTFIHNLFKQVIDDAFELWDAISSGNIGKTLILTVGNIGGIGTASRAYQNTVNNNSSITTNNYYGTPNLAYAN